MEKKRTGYTDEPKPGDFVIPRGWQVNRCSEQLVTFVGIDGLTTVDDLVKVCPGVWKLINQKALGDNG
jgi:hypothetical protein